MLELGSAARAVATNVVAGVAPLLYVRLTRQTGRGTDPAESAQEVATYFQQSFDDYLAQLGVQRDGAEAFLGGKTVVEYGPGDLPGVAALMVAYGARRVHCVDRFAMVRLSAKNLEVLERLSAGLPPAQAARMRALLVAGAQGPELDRASIDYAVRPHGFSGLQSAADLLLSRAVLALVDDLEGTFADMFRALKPGGVALHQVDLRSHGFHRREPLDFLNWSPWLWTLMHSNKGVPNRWRLDRYRAIVNGLPLEDVSFEIIKHTTPDVVARLKPRFAHRFRAVADEDLCALAFWLRFRKPGR